MRASLAAVKDPAVRRDAAGILKGISEENENTLLPVSFAFEYLFPGITTQTSVLTLKNLMTAKGRVSGTEFLPSAFDTDLNAAQITARFRLIMRLFYAYRTLFGAAFLHRKPGWTSRSWRTYSPKAPSAC